MGGDHLHPPEVPDWRTFKVEDSEELMKLKKTLEARGLCYPWLRNEVWKFKKCNVRNIRQAIWYTFKGGLKYGLPAAIITIIIDKAYLAYVDKTYGGAHGEGHH